MAKTFSNVREAEFEDIAGDLDGSKVFTGDG